MNTLDLETRLRQALAVATAPRSVVDDVMRQLPATLSKPVPLSPWRRPAVLASFAAPALVVVILAFLLFSTSTAVRMTLADVQAAVERQPWVHVKYDAGPTKEWWTNLRTGEQYIIGLTGTVDYLVYANEQTNTRLSYWKDSGVIRQAAPVQYAAGRGPRPWTPETAWQSVVAPLEREVDATKRANSSPASVVSAPDSLNGKPVIRFDSYSSDGLGNRFLHSQLWADPQTHLPLRLRTRLQLAYRETSGKEWSTGDYDFPASGPADLYALGVPRGTLIVKEVTTAPKTVQPVLDAINHAHDGFLRNYRAVVWKTRRGSQDPVDGLDIIWRDGERVRQDHHMPGYEVQRTHAPPLPQPNPAALLAWASQAEPSEKQLMDRQREYMWRSATVAKSSKPQVHVISHGNFPLLATDAWPERIQWPTRNYEPNFQVIPENAETPKGCIGLRGGGDGNSRVDYYVDPTNDYVCLKQTYWTKRGADWAKSREYTLSDLHRVAGHVVAGRQVFHGYGDPTQHLSESTETTTIDLVPLSAADYPPGIFDPASLTHGANVVGY
jgi:hypothetical protein